MAILVAFVVGFLLATVCALIVCAFLVLKNKKEVAHSIIISEQILKDILVAADKYEITPSEMVQKWIKLGFVVATLNEDLEERIIIESVDLHTGKLMRQELRM